MNAVSMIRDGFGLIFVGGFIMWLVRPRKQETVSVEQHDVLIRDGNILGHASDCQACKRHK